MILALAMTLSAHAAEAPASVKADHQAPVPRLPPPELQDFEKYMRRAQRAERAYVWGMPLALGSAAVLGGGTLLYETAPVVGGSLMVLGVTGVAAGELALLGGWGVSTVAGLRAYQHLDAPLRSGGALLLFTGAAVACFGTASGALLYNLAPEAGLALGSASWVVGGVLWMVAPVLQVEQLLQLAPGGPREGSRTHQWVQKWTVGSFVTVVDGQPALGLAGTF